MESRFVPADCCAVATGDSSRRVKMRHLTAVALLLSCHGISASPIQARSRISSAEDLKSGHSAARAEVERIWATQEPPLQELLCSVPANAGSVLKNYNIRQAPAVTASVPVIDSLRSAGVPVYSACQVCAHGRTEFECMRYEGHGGLTTTLLTYNYRSTIWCMER